MAEAAPHAAGVRALDPCVHCGFCLPACPTYEVTGDEADSPRGRIVLMRALAAGDLSPLDPALGEHLDACLGCRACEPACPSGVGYGEGLADARAHLARARGFPPLARLVLAVFRREFLWRPALALATLWRDTGLAARLAGWGRVGFGMGMIAGTAPWSRGTGAGPAAAGATRGRVALFRGCVMDTLFAHVNAATARTLRANGYEVVEIAGQGCCGALHEHAGARDQAEALAKANVAALPADTDFVVVNSAGCGALLKEYGHLLGTEAARAFGAKVRDVSELLAAAGPRPGAPLPLDVAYDAPCHLQHAQRVHAAPLAVLRAIPALRLHLLPGHDRCCGSAGIFSLLQPGMSRAVLQEKLRVIREASPRPAVLATGNPGCHMQFAAGLRAAGMPVAVAHPVELLDRAYGEAGYYGGAS